MNRTLLKSERLHLKNEIANLFETGERGHHYPIRTVLNLKVSTEPGLHVSVLVSVSKRNFRRAHDRNRIKRRLREAYRLNKRLLFNSAENPSSQNGGLLVHIGFLYSSKTMEPWSLVEKKVCRILQEIREKISTFSHD